MLKQSGLFTPEDHVKSGQAMQSAMVDLLLKQRSAIEGEGYVMPNASKGPAIIQSASDRKDYEARKKENQENALAKDEAEDDPDFDDDPDLVAIREKRLRELKAEANKVVILKAAGHGEYYQVDQDDFLGAVTKSEYVDHRTGFGLDQHGPLARKDWPESREPVVCHFFHKDFERCKIVDKHMKLLAPKHLQTKFISMDAEKTPFFVEKLAIRLLPTIVLFVDGIAVDRIVGFDELGSKDDFPTELLERRLARSGVIEGPKGDRIQAHKKTVKTLLEV